MSLQNPKVGFVSLGCPKALVDSERILTQLRVEGYDIVPTYDAADVVVVNTCGFIDSAVAESLDAIGEAMNQNGKVIVTGCLGKRPEQIREQYPDVLAISGPQDYQSVMEALHEALPPKHDPFVDLVPDYGVKLTPRAKKYIKENEIDPASVAGIKGTGYQGGICEKDIKASPLAKKLAEKLGVDLVGVAGTGIQGKVMKKGGGPAEAAE